MASSEICPHGYPSPKSCMTCLEDDGVGAEPVRLLTSEGPTFTANYDGQCSGVGACNLPGTGTTGHHALGAHSKASWHSASQLGRGTAR